MVSAFGGMGTYYAHALLASNTSYVWRSDVRAKYDGTIFEHVCFNVGLHRWSVSAGRPGLYVDPRTQPLFGWGESSFWQRNRRQGSNRANRSNGVRLGRGRATRSTGARGAIG